MLVVYVLLGAFVRRWYGGLFPDKKYKILGNRGLQSLCMIVLFLSIYVTQPSSWQCWLAAIGVSLWIQFAFWSRGHGEVADCGRHTNITPQDLIRYNERWYHVPCDWLFEKEFKRPDQKYGFLYDFIYLTFRYTFPMVPLMLFDWKYILIGLSIAPIYAFCMTLQEREAWLFNPNNQWHHRGWDFAEYLSGAVVYGGCYLIGWGS